MKLWQVMGAGQRAGDSFAFAVKLYEMRRRRFGLTRSRQVLIIDRDPGSIFHTEFPNMKKT